MVVSENGVRVILHKKIYSHCLVQKIFYEFFLQTLFVRKIRKITSFILKKTRLNYYYAFYCCFDNFHCFNPNSLMTFNRYCPYWFFIIGWANSYILFASIHPFRRAIPSKQATFNPCRFSITSMKVEASESESCVPVSSHANPRPSN